MKSTGIIRRIDDLGRIVIPKEIKRTLGLRDGDPMEIFVDGRRVVLEKYHPAGIFEDHAREYARSFESVTQRHVFFTDTEKVIVSLPHSFSGFPLSTEMIEAIRCRQDAENIPLLAGENGAVAAFAAVIRDGSRNSPGDGIGAVVLLRDELPADDEIRAKILIAADYLGRLVNANDK